MFSRCRQVVAGTAVALATLLSCTSGAGFPAAASSSVVILSGSTYGLSVPFVEAGVAGNVWILNAGGPISVVNATSFDVVKLLEGTTYQFGGSSQAALAVSGSDVWVVGGSNDNELVELSGSTAQIQKSVDVKQYASGPAVLSLSTSLSVADGAIWVLGSLYQRLVKISLTSGKVLKSIDESKTMAESFIQVGADLWVAGLNGTLQERSASSGKLLRTFTLGANTVLTGVLMTAAAGDLWIPDNNRVIVFSLSKVKVIARISGAKYRLGGSGYAGTDGTHVWVANQRTNSVSQFSSKTLAFESAMSGAPYKFSAPFPVLFYEHELWVANQASGGVDSGSLTVIPIK